jgi:hypothetical protein
VYFSGCTGSALPLIVACPPRARLIQGFISHDRITPGSVRRCAGLSATVRCRVGGSNTPIKHMIGMRARTHARQELAGNVPAAKHASHNFNTTSTLNLPILYSWIPGLYRPSHTPLMAPGYLLELKAGMSSPSMWHGGRCRLVYLLRGRAALALSRPRGRPTSLAYLANGCQPGQESLFAPCPAFCLAA